jgi:hypothetical protein
VHPPRCQTAPVLQGASSPDDAHHMSHVSCIKIFSEIRFTEIKAGLMDDPDISREVKHRIQVASQPGSGTASLIMIVTVRVPTELEECLDTASHRAAMDAAIQAACCRLGLPIPGLHLRARCLPNCTQMGPHATLTDTSSTVSESLSVMTGTHFQVPSLGCKCCHGGTYRDGRRHNEVP